MTPNIDQIIGRPLPLDLNKSIEKAIMISNATPEQTRNNVRFNVGKKLVPFYKDIVSNKTQEPVAPKQNMPVF